jgi:hypothetical protein
MGIPIIAPGGIAPGGGPATGLPAGIGPFGAFRGFPVGIPGGMSGGFGALDIISLFLVGQEDSKECLKSRPGAGRLQITKRASRTTDNNDEPLL